MIPTHLYNENDSKAASWLTQLIEIGELPLGSVIEKSIVDVGADELSGYTQCHFFAGIGGWPYALKLAGWPESAPIWTGSCPCQPFSTAGKGKGTDDSRHLWPDFKRLIEQHLPTVVVGEQVASKAGREWLNGVRVDLEALGYAVGASDLCAAGVGSPHIRQRLYWVGIRQGHDFSGLGESKSIGCERSRQESGCPPEASSQLCGNRLAHTQYDGSCGAEEYSTIQNSNGKNGGLHNRSVTNAWDGYEFVGCRDNKTRRIESGTFPLVDGLPRGVVQSGDISLSQLTSTKEAHTIRLKGYGNAIVPQLAAVFIESVMEILCGIY